MLFQIGVKTAVMVWFEANQNMIAAEQCENRDRPMMHCNGQCVLAKKLKQAEANQESQTAPIQDIHNDLLPFVLETQSDLKSRSGQKMVYNSTSNLYSFLPSTYFFHPPPVTI